MTFFDHQVSNGPTTEESKDDLQIMMYKKVHEGGGGGVKVPQRKVQKNIRVAHKE